MATIDHLKSKLDLERNLPNYSGERRLVLSCVKCNQKRNIRERKKLIQKYGQPGRDLFGDIKRGRLKMIKMLKNGGKKNGIWGI